MKIIKNNVKPEPTVIITCKFCTSILEVTADELTEYPPLKVLVENDETGYGFNCPCCKQYAYVQDNSVLPSEFTKKVKKFKSKYV